MAAPQERTAPSDSAVKNAAVSIESLVKSYPGRSSNAVDGLSLEVRQGEVFGLLGPNGAGKSTTIGILTTRVIPTSGTARVFDVDVVSHPVAARRLLGVVPQVNNLDRALNAWQNLTFHAAYHGVPRSLRKAKAAQLMESFGLSGRDRDDIATYSGGMAQRLLIARALMHDPRMLFLDEPTTGLDPQSRLFVWDRIRELRAAGVTIVLTTHDMDEAAELSDRVGIIDHGRLLALGTVDELTHGLEGRSILDLTIGRVDLPAHDILSGVEGVESIEKIESGNSGPPGNPGGDPPPWGQSPPAATAPPAAESNQTRLRLYLSRDPALVLGPVAQTLAKHDCPITRVQIGEPSLEDVFISLTGRSLR
ncbi:ABC transporter ATP-binding protein [Thermostaphylospora chromogena]|uniref:ABC-2 type transport system ATP-binding protein n=1 Tax=Thermostaphylospora chromogena TaxID=35622 RepID=A0A1H1CR43_9ACTN|nr:ABC transporter ATP-binding protein [Thermostaphylospora chromogena]SDQ66642.1 ABC-2 type transport system ATP-binding protein [Thermostaphylospora chromogena]